MTRLSPDNEALLRKLWAQDERAPAIASRLNVTAASVYAWANKLGLPKRPHLVGKPRSSGPSTSRSRDTTGQRRFSGVVSEGPRVVLQPHHPAARKATTFFPSTVRPTAQVARLLKSGEHSRKLGAVVTKGRWKGFPIFSLTLEERDTCPRSCSEWLTCYGNNMPFSTRILDDGTLTRRLWGELASLNAEHPAGFVVRLHVLGDFFSVEYVEFWQQALNDFPALHVFGFTARTAADPIGQALRQLTAAAADPEHEHVRFMMRFSGWESEMMASEVVSSADDARYTVCPAENDPDRCCATCALCFNSLKSITFIRH